MQTITIKFTDGTSITFTDCSGYSRDANWVSFKGKKQNESVIASWDYPAKDVAEVKRVDQ